MEEPGCSAESRMGSLHDSSARTTYLALQASPAHGPIPLTREPSEFCRMDRLRGAGCTPDQMVWISFVLLLTSAFIVDYLVCQTITVLSLFHKGIVHPKIIIIYSLSCCSKPVRLLNTNEDSLMMKINYDTFLTLLLQQSNYHFDTSKSS